MKKALPIAITVVLTLSACGNRSDPGAAAGDRQLNPDATVLQPPASETPPARSNAENPDTGTNNRRPDSPRDLQPGTDGNSPPVR